MLAKNEKFKKKAKYSLRINKTYNTKQKLKEKFKTQKEKLKLNKTFPQSRKPLGCFQ